MLDLAIDRSAMLRWLSDYPRQLRLLYPEGGRAGREAAAAAAPFSNVCVLGTGGGSAAAAHVVAALVRSCLRVPLAVCQGYEPPAYVLERTRFGHSTASPRGRSLVLASPHGRSLVLAVSHSGLTEETLIALQTVSEVADSPRSASAPAVVVLSGGGRLAAEAKRAGWPSVALPTGMAARAVFPGIVAAILGLLEGADLAGTSFEDQVEEAASLSERLAVAWGPEAGSSGPSGDEAIGPEALAGRLADRLLLIYGGAGATEGAARRWKNQMAENGKTLAHWSIVPEAHHDEVVGWDMPAAVRERLFACVLRDPAAESPRMRRRLDATSRLLRERVVGPEGLVEVAAVGASPLARVVSLCLYGDYLSCYLALHRGIDPTPVPIIAALKEEMARD